MPDLTLRLTVGAMRSLLAPIVPLAEQEKEPTSQGVALRMIRVTVRGGFAYAFATDRVVLGVKRVTATSHADMIGYVDVDEARAFLRSLPRAKKNAADPAALDLVDEDDLRNPFPNVSRLLEVPTEVAAPEIVGNLDPISVAKFSEACKMSEHRAPINWHTVIRRFGTGDLQTAPVRLTIGDDFFGMIQPRRDIRATSNVNGTPEWAIEATR